MYVIPRLRIVLTAKLRWVNSPNSANPRGRAIPLIRRRLKKQLVGQAKTCYRTSWSVDKFPRFNNHVTKSPHQAVLCINGMMPGGIVIYGAVRAMPLVDDVTTSF